MKKFECFDDRIRSIDRRLTSPPYGTVYNTIWFDKACQQSKYYILEFSSTRQMFATTELKFNINDNEKQIREKKKGRRPTHGISYELLNKRYILLNAE